MAHSQLEGRVPVVAASTMGALVPITFLGAVGGAGGSALSETVIRTGTFGDPAIGITQATVVAAGDPVTYWQRGDVGKAVAAASLGAGAFVAVGSSNGVLVPQLASSGAAPTAVRYRVGTALKNAVAGDIFPVYIDPQQTL